MAAKVTLNFILHVKYLKVATVGIIEKHAAWMSHLDITIIQSANF